ARLTATHTPYRDPPAPPEGVLLEVTVTTERPPAEARLQLLARPARREEWMIETLTQQPQREGALHARRDIEERRGVVISERVVLGLRQRVPHEYPAVEGVQREGDTESEATPSLPLLPLAELEHPAVAVLRIEERDRAADT